jgi:hypothetical protein
MGGTAWSTPDFAIEAANASSRAEALEPSKKDPPLTGLSLAGFRVFIDSHGGRGAFKGKSTEAVKREFVLPAVASSGVSYCEELLATGSPNVAPATHFVSHAYAAPFLKSVDALEAWEERQIAAGATGPFIYFFDLLVLRPRGVAESSVSMEVLCNDFGTGMRGIGHTLLLMEWGSVAALKRSWCLFELFTTLAVGAALDIVMAPDDDTAFVAALDADFDGLVGKTLVDVEAARASVPEEAAYIRQLLAKSVISGCAAADGLVTDKLRDWLASRARAVLVGRQMQLGNSHADTLRSLNSLAALLREQLRLDEAEPLLRAALAGCRRGLGDIHPSTLASLATLASLHRDQGRFADALPLIDEALAGYRRIFSTSRLETLTALLSAAAVRQSLGRLDEAEELLREALAGYRRVLGADHAQTFACMNALAALFRQQGKLDNAEPLLRASLAGTRLRLGDGDPMTLLGINNLAALLREKGEKEVDTAAAAAAFGEAEPLLQEALAGCRRVFGASHPNSYLSATSLAELYLAQGKLDAAEPLFREALAGCRHVLGATHPNTLASIANMAALLREQRKLDAAVPLAREALAGRRQVLGDDHPVTLGSIDALVALLRAQGQLGEAVTLQQEALATRRRKLGETHADSLRSASALIGTLREVGRLADAEALQREAVVVSRRMHGDDHRETVACLNALAALLRAQGKVAEAEPLHEEAVASLQRVQRAEARAGGGGGKGGEEAAAKSPKPAKAATGAPTP